MNNTGGWQVAWALVRIDIHHAGGMQTRLTLDHDDLETQGHPARYTYIRRLECTG